MPLSTHLFSENLLCMMRGALIMLFIGLAVRLYPRRKENPILGFLFWLLTIMTVLLFFSLGFMIKELKDNTLYNELVVLLDMCLIPMIGGFLMTIVMPDYVNSKKSLILTIPSIVLLIAHIFTHNVLLYKIALGYSVLVAAVCFIITIVVSIRYDYYLKNNFSNIENRAVGWVRTVVLIFTAWYLAWGLIVIHDDTWLDSLYYVFLIAIWSFIYKYSIKHVTSFQTQELFDKPEVLEIESPHLRLRGDSIGAKLEQYMKDDCSWLNPSLTLQELATSLGTNRTYLSEYFNKEVGTTFYDYLNGFRIQYACQILLEEPELSIIQVGEKSGFNSLSTFRRAFEKHIGCTPAKYRG